MVAEDALLTGGFLSSVALIGYQSIQKALDIDLSLSIVFSKSSDDDNVEPDKPNNPGECGPGPGGGDNPESRLRKIVRKWAHIAALLMSLDGSAEAGMQSSRAHIKILETIEKIEEAQRRSKRDDEEEGGDGC
jgi:hypothetical protein